MFGHRVEMPSSTPHLAIHIIYYKYKRNIKLNVSNVKTKFSFLLDDPRAYLHECEMEQVHPYKLDLVVSW